MIIGIIGSGTMGTGIAQQAAMAGYEVRIFDINHDKLNRTLNDISLSLGKLSSKRLIEHASISAIIGRIYICTSINTLSDCDLVIEAIHEDMQAKKDLFIQLEQIVSEQCILATNTSSLSVTAIASVLKKPNRFLGIHFFNPVVIMELVEVIPAIQTCDNTSNRTMDLILSWRKHVVISNDTPGFIVNKVARPYYCEALRILEEGIADIFIIDGIMKNFGFKMGPFELMDFIGHDVNYRVTESIWKSFYFDDRYKPSFLQLRLLEAGYLGKKSNKGFYSYPIDKTQITVENKLLSDKIFLRIIALMINEAADTIHLGICTQNDVEKAVILGLNYPKGLLEWGKEIGFQNIINTMNELYEYYHEDRYRVCPLMRNWT